MARLTNPIQFYNDEKGRTLKNAKLYFYDSGTFDVKDTYSDAALTSVNPNPVVADGAGRFPNIFMGTGSYRLVLEDEDGVEIATKDDVANIIGDGEDISTALNVTTATGTQTVAGALDDRVINRETIADLRATEPTTDKQHASVLYHNNYSSRGGSTFWYDSSDTSSSDDDATVIVTPGGARWKTKKEFLPASAYGAQRGVASDFTSEMQSYSQGLSISTSYQVTTLNTNSNQKFSERVTDDGTNGNIAYSVSDNTQYHSLISARIDSVDGQAYVDQSENSRKLRIIDSDLIGASYGFLSSDTGTVNNNTEGFIINSSYIYSDRADPIELNHYNRLAKYFVTGDVILETGTGSTNPASGFGYGVAGTDGHVFSNGIIMHARNEALHVEDGQKGGNISNVYAAQCLDSGLALLGPLAAQGDADGVNVSNLTLRHTGTKTGFYGVHFTQGVDGSLDSNSLTNVRAIGFDYGFNVSGGDAEQHNTLSGCFAVDCNVGVNATGYARIDGSITTKDCPTVARMNNRTYIEKVVSETTPTTFIEFTGGTNLPGAVIERWTLPLTVTHTGGGGTELDDLMTMPERLIGQFYMELKNNNNYFYTTLTAKWDGTTFTVIDEVPAHFGALSGATLVSNSGNLALSVASSSAYTDALLTVSFVGSFYATSNISIA